MNMQTRETKAAGDQVLLLFIISSTSQTLRQLKKKKNSLVRKAKAVVCVCVSVRACAFVLAQSVLVSVTGNLKVPNNICIASYMGQFI